MTKERIRGVGLGLRSAHTPYILEKKPDLDWIEFLFDNFRCYGGNSRKIVERISSFYPCALHCLGMNLGSLDPIDYEYLKDLKELKKYSQACWVSDHLCWGTRDGVYYHDLLPLPFTQEVLEHLTERIDAVQNFLGEGILVENISSYFEISFSEMDEAEFLRQLCKEADCSLLLDINNLYVNARNHGWDAQAMLRKIPKERVRQYHLGGHESLPGPYLLDSHGNEICKEVWQLFEQALGLIGAQAVSIERDTKIPPFQELYQEVQRAKEILKPHSTPPL